MNKQLYRIVFNAARGQLMAVAETVAGRRCGSRRRSRRPTASMAVFPLWVVFGVTLCLASAVEAQIIAYRNAPGRQQATILKAGNGVPLVNIQTPSGAGVSRNAYSQFDVQTTGAILNNSRTDTATQLAGWVQGNPWLATGSARVILNEVISANPTLLQGYLEVAGSSAQVVIANPAGINCAGCGFINANRSTLTTGTPLINGGDLDGYRVEGGSIRIQGDGMDASRVTHTELIARAVEINAGLWANTLTITTGANQVDADQRLATPIAAAGAAPFFALDVAQLGGMYAGKITLLGTEAGVGVRNAGQIGASVGEVSLSVDGRLFNSGRITSTTQARIDSGNGIENSGTIYAQSDATLSTRGDIDNSGLIAAHGDAALSATGNGSRINGSASSMLGAGVDADGRLGGSARLTVGATEQIVLHGQAVASGEQAMVADSLDLSDSQSSARTLKLVASHGDLDARRSILSAAGTLSASAGQRLLHDDARSNAQQLRLAAHDISNVQGELIQTGSGDTAIALAGDFNNTHGRLASNGQRLTLSARNIDNSDGAIIHAGRGTLELTADTLGGTRGNLGSNGRLDLVARELILDGASTVADGLRIKAATLSNRDGQIVQTGIGEAVVSSTAGFDNRGGSLMSSGPTTLTLGALDNRSGTLSVTNGARLALSASGAVDNSSGLIGAEGDVDLAAQSLRNAQGEITAGQALQISTSQSLDNAHGMLAALDKVSLRSQGIDNTLGTIGSVHGQLVADAGGASLVNDAGRIEAAQALTLAGSGVINRDGVITGQNLQLDSRGQAFDNSRGTIDATGALDLQSGVLNNDAGLIQATGALAIDTHGQALSNINSGASGGIRGQGRLTVAAGDFDNRTGIIGAAGDLELAVHSLGNAQGQIMAGQSLQISISQKLDNARGTLAANGNVRLYTLGLDNTEGTIAAVRGQLVADAGSGALRNDGGRLEAAQALTLAASGISNADGTIVGQDLQLDSRQQRFDNTRGTIAAAGALDLQSGVLSNDAGLIQAAGLLAIDTHGQALSNTQSGASRGILGKSALTLAAGEFDNTSGVVGTPGEIKISAQAVRNGQGQITAGNTLELDAGRKLDNSQGLLAANNDVSVHAFGIDNSRGSIGSVRGQLVADAGGASLANSAGRIEAARTVTVAGAALINSDGVITGQDLQLDSRGQALDNTRGTLAAGGALTLESGALNNAGGLIQSAGALAIDTHGQMLSNTNSGASGGILGQGALILAAGDLDNSTGLIGAQGQIQLTAQAVRNAQGQIKAGDSLRIAASRNIDNRQGLLAANNELSLRSLGLDNSQGRIGSVHGPLLADAGGAALRNDGGRIEAATAVTLSGSGIANADGTIVGRELQFDSRSQAFDNTRGAIAASGALKLQSGALNNNGGLIQAAGPLDVDTHDHALSNINSGAGGGILGQGALTLNTGELNNSAGVIGAQGQILLSAQTVRNAQGQITAGQTLQIDSRQQLDNRQGVLAANDGVSLHSSGIDNSQGRIASVRGQLVADSGSASLVNSAGRIEAAQSLSLAGAGVANSDGTVVGQNLQIDSRARDFDNSRGTLAASGALDLQSGALRNDGGLIQAGGVLTIDTHGQALSNTDSGASRGILGQSALILATGELDNTAGFIGAKGPLGVSATDIDNNAGGSLSSEQAITLDALRLNNRGGQIQALGSVSLAVGGNIDNTSGLIRSGDALKLSADSLINANTLDANQGIEGQSLSIAGHRIDNRRGALRANQTLKLTSGGTIDNSGGLISSADTLIIRDPRASDSSNSAAKTLALINTGGTLIADRQLSVDGASLGGDGAVLSLDDLYVKLLADFTQSGQFAANGNAALETAGTLSNRAKIQAGKRLSLTAASLDNGAAGEIVASELHLSATDSHSLTNRGLIDGSETLIEGETINNLGTGRIYGDHLAIAAATLSNDAEAGVAPVIAARRRLDIGAMAIDNREHALLFSAGDLAIGGALDAGHQAIGQAATLNNASATIEALGDLTINAGQVNNTNEHFSTGVQALDSQQILEYQGSGAAARYPAGTPGVYVHNDESDQLMTPEGNYQDWLSYNYTRNTTETRVTSSDPGKILAGGAMQLGAYALLNDNSQIIAGGALIGNIGALNNVEPPGQRTISDTGTVTSFWRNHQKGRDNTGSSIADYNPPSIIESITLGTAVYQQYTAPTGSGTTAGSLTINPLNQNAAGAQDAKAGVGSVQTPAHTTQVSASVGQGQTPSPGAPVDPAVGTGQTVAQTTQVGSSVGAGQTVTRSTQTRPTIGISQPVARLTQVPALAGNTRSGPAMVVRSVSPNTALPNNSLFRTNTSPGSHYLVETDPQFASYRQWLSSDYLLNALALDPAIAQKRLGDGFYEQRLLREQIAQLTGQRFLDGYADDEAQYQALMDAGATVASAWGLIPGVALSAEQMAALTTDIVWLVEQTIELPDGHSARALVPQIYARVRDGDLLPSGALIAGNNIKLELAGDLTNSGTIAGRQIVALSAENIGNLGGRISGQDNLVSARNDLVNLGGILQADRTLVVSAGHDLTIASSTHSESNAQGSRSGIDRLAALYVSGDKGTLIAKAGNDLTLLAAAIANAGPTAVPAGNAAGSTALIASRDLTLGTVSEGVSNRIVWDAKNTRSDSRRSDVGSAIRSAGDLTLQAGRDLTAKAASVRSDLGALAVLAGNTLSINAGESSVQVDEAHQHSETGFLSRTTRSTRDTLDATSSLASTLSGESTTLLAGQDIRITGSNVVATHDTTLVAGNDISVEAAAETRNETHFSEIKKSGIFSSGAVGFTIGSMQLSTDQKSQGRSAAASTLGSTDGDVIIEAGNAYRQVGSDIIAPHGSIDLAAKTVDILEARETWRSVVETKAKQSGLTVALTSPVVSAVQTVQQMADAASQTKDSRMQLLAAASSALAVNNAADAIKAGQGQTTSDGKVNQIDTGQSNPDGSAITRDATAIDKLGGVNLSISFGSSSSSSTATQSSDRAAGSTLSAGHDLRIVARGAGTGSDITVQGSNLSAGGDITLKADDEIRLLASRNIAEQHSTNQNRSASVGFSIGTVSGLAFNAGASSGHGKADGADTTWSNTHVEAGNTLTLESGGDTTLRGAVARGEQVIASVGSSGHGNLLIESLQDSNTYNSQQQSAGFSLSVGYGLTGLGGSLGASRSKINSDFASVAEQSGIKAGDGGFQVKVKGDTELVGAVIASTQSAVDNNRNAFTTDGALRTSDIQNRAEYSATSASVNLGSSISFDGKLKPGGTSAGFGQDSGSAASTTTAGISGIAGNTAVRSGDAQTGIARIFDAEKVQKEIDAQVRITQMFNELAPKAAADYAKNQISALKTRAEAETDLDQKTALLSEASKWAPNGSYNIAMNIIIGAAGGGTTGAASSITKETLSWAANEMRQAMIEDSKKFKGLCASENDCISNMTGKSIGVNGDNTKIAGGRIVLSDWCADGRCEKNAGTKSGYKENSDGTVIFNPGKDAQGTPITISQFVELHPEWQSPLGGLQGGQGQMELFGIKFGYAKGSFWDKLAETYSGTHDTLNSFIWYDNLGNAKNLNGTIPGNVGDITNFTNVWLATPFALSVLLPPEVWNAMISAVKLVR